MALINRVFALAFKKYTLNMEKRLYISVSINYDVV